jgi:hypothetical protein
LPNDHFTETGARRIAARVEKYWGKQGHEVRCHLIPLLPLSDGTCKAWGVGSDMLRGWPWRVAMMADPDLLLKYPVQRGRASKPKKPPKMEAEPVERVRRARVYVWPEAELEPA